VEQLDLGRYGVAGAAAAGARRVAPLDDKARFYAVKSKTVVKALLGQEDEIVDGFRGGAGVEPGDDVAFGGRDGGALYMLLRSAVFAGIEVELLSAR